MSQISAIIRFVSFYCISEHYFAYHVILITVQMKLSGSVRPERPDTGQ